MPPRGRVDTQGWAIDDPAASSTPAPPSAASVITPVTDTEGTAAVQEIEPYEIVLPDDYDIFQHFTVTRTGLVVKGHPDKQDWARMGGYLRFMETCIQFALGDWMNAGEGLYGEQEVAQLVDSKVFTYSTLRNYAWVSEKVPPVNRIKGLDFKFHQLAASLPVHDQKTWLAKAVDKGWTTKEFDEELKKKKHGLRAETVFYVIVACDDESDQQQCVRQLENLGRDCTLKVEKKLKALVG